MRDKIRVGIFGLSILVGVLLLVYSFLLWRFDFSLFGFTNLKFYVLSGVGAAVLPVLLFIWGFTIGLYTCGFSLLIMGGLFVFQVLLDKRDQYDLSIDVIVYCLIALGMGLLAMFFGSKQAHDDREEYAQAEWNHSIKPVVCAKCDQHLGRAGSFQSPCPRCGSNRYVVE